MRAADRDAVAVLLHRIAPGLPVRSTLIAATSSALSSFETLGVLRTSASKVLQFAHQEMQRVHQRRTSRIPQEA